LSGIAERFGITVNDIATLNSITDTGHILAGQTLLVPAPYLPTPALTVTATATPVITGTAPPLVIEPDAIVTPEPDTIVTDTNTVIP
jgi:LysM repeat protein